MHFNTEPPGLMCGVWVALEDIDMDCGPLVYYPGSHRLPPVTPEDVGIEIAPGQTEVPHDEYQARYREYDTQVAWVAEDKVEVRFKVKGIKLAGTLELLPREIALDMQVPLALQLFKGRAVKTIEDTVSPWLAKAKRGELG